MGPGPGGFVLQVCCLGAHCSPSCIEATVFFLLSSGSSLGWLIAIIEQEASVLKLPTMLFTESMAPGCCREHTSTQLILVEGQVADWVLKG